MNSSVLSSLPLQFGQNSLQTFSLSEMSKRVDGFFIALLALLICVGIVFEASASVAIAASRTGDAFYYLQRHLVFLTLGMVAALMAFQISMRTWMNLSPWILFVGLILLVLVLIPGLGVRVNGSQRWLHFGLLSFQVSEFAKLAMMLFLAGYLVRRGDELRARWSGFSKPLLVLAMMLVLLLLEPDFGAAVVMSGTVLGLLFLAGIPLMRFLLTLSAAVILLGFLATSSGYRMNRILAFMDPWADQFNSGYQLTQALIAFGRGEWFGVGLGNSLQKLFYLPEAHTDFVFAVIAEETGLFGAGLVIVLLWMLGQRIIRIGRSCIEAACIGAGPQMLFAGYLVLGIGIMFLIQCFINIGVSCGLLPTKGLTLPFISYGGSSLLIWILLMTLVARAVWELKAVSASTLTAKTRSAGVKRSGKAKGGAYVR